MKEKCLNYNCNEFDERFTSTALEIAEIAVSHISGTATEKLYMLLKDVQYYY